MSSQLEDKLLKYKTSEATFHAAFPLSFIDNASDKEIIEWRDNHYERNT